MARWLTAALEHLPRWIEFQMRQHEQPGCALAIVHRGKLVLEAAFGHADLSQGLPLSPRHRFRVASHSKTFTAAGVMALREQGRLSLDQRVGSLVGGLHPRVARITIGQLLSHAGGLVRDGADSGQWSDRRPFLNAAEVLADLADGPTIEPNTRFKYSNHGYALLGMAIEALTGRPYGEWINDTIVAPSGLHETLPDAPLPRGTPLARGHGTKLPLGRRVTIPVENPTHALAPATGFVSTAADLAHFHASLIPQARNRVLSADSRREMRRPQWRDPHATNERWYGLGTISASIGDWELCGHSGGFQGTVTRTAGIASQDLAVSVLTNATDGLAHAWLDGIVHLLRACAQRGAPTRAAANWTGRWWSLWGALDLLPMGDRVLVANPGLPQPLQDAPEIEPLRGTRDGVTRGRIVLANGFAAHGEPVRLRRDARGRALEFWLAGNRLLPEAAVATELQRRYEPAPAQRGGVPAPPLSARAARPPAGRAAATPASTGTARSRRRS